MAVVLREVLEDMENLLVVQVDKEVVRLVDKVTVLLVGKEVALLVDMGIVLLVGKEVDLLVDMVIAHHMEDFVEQDYIQVAVVGNPKKSRRMIN